MNLTRIISIKERIAISSEWKPDERDFILEAINEGIERARSRSSAGTEHADWAEDDYKRARDCMLGILRDSAWTITKDRDEKQFDNAFQHAVGILSLTARRLPDVPQRVAQTALLECRDFIADLVGGAKFEERAFANAKELIEQADAALSLSRPEQAVSTPIDELMKCAEGLARGAYLTPDERNLVYQFIRRATAGSSR